MIPKGRESGFSDFTKFPSAGTSLVGSLVFGIVVGITGSFRQAILSMIVFFAVGILILLFTDTDRAIREAGNLTPEEAAGTRVKSLFYACLAI
jgi:UMF1 family MFS transporter